MSERTTYRAPKAPTALRLLARLLVSGPEARFVRRDLDDLLERDIERGIPRRRAVARYCRNLVGSASSLWWARLRRPRLPGISWLDVKLGGRMLAKYPGLTIVGGSAMAFAIAVGVAIFVIIAQLVFPNIPLDEGDRIVGIVNWDSETGNSEPRQLHDFVTWRDEVASIEEIGAARSLGLNLIVDGQVSAPLVVAQVSGSAFGVARVPALRGRVLGEADMRADGPAVMVIGFDVWRTRFGSDPDVIGRVVRLGKEATTIVGVMPEGFRFPIAHNAWTPLPHNVLDYERRAGPPINVFGRLAAGFSLEQAQAELTAIGARTAIDFPKTHERLLPRVLPYARSILDLPAVVSLALYSFNLVAVVFLVLVCANVALLVYARTATRNTEIVIRSALGAARKQIIMQFFAEALVLGGVAAAIGLVAAAFGGRWAINTFATVVGMPIPFWFDFRPSYTSIFYVCVLTLLAAAVAGILPALKATGRKAQAQLQLAVAGGRRVTFGGVWTAVIVTQIALTVIFVPAVIIAGFQIAEIRATELGFPAGEYLSAELVMHEEAMRDDVARDDVPDEKGIENLYRELERRLRTEPGIAEVTFTARLPGAYHPRQSVEIEGTTEPPVYGTGHRPQATSVDLGFFDALGASIVDGRAFHSGDLDSDAGVVIVNQAFVSDILGGRNAIGRRLRYLNGDEPEGPWHEIVGVVEQLAMNIDPDLKTAAGFYHPARPADLRPFKIVVRVGGDPLAFAPRLRALTADVDPMLGLYQLLPMQQAAWATLQTYEFWFQVAVVAIGLALLLALAGIYSIMSFTVSQRTREIGVRVALGAQRRGIVVAVLAHATAQVATGVVVGVLMFVALVMFNSDGGTGIPPRWILPIVGYGVVMVFVCMLAAVVPTHRALSVEPTEALRADT